MLWPVIAFVVMTGSPLLAQDFSTVLPAKYNAEYEDLLSDPSNLERIFELARRAEVDAQQSGSIKGYRFAIRLYERMLLIDPELTQAALRLGEIHYRLGEFVEAGSYFRRAIQDSALPSDVRVFAQSYLDNIEDALARNRFSGRLVVGLKYQTNPSLEDEPFAFPVPQGSDFNLFAGASLTHVFDPGWQTGHRIVTTLDATAQKYSSFDEIDSSLVDLTFGPRFRLDSYGFGNTTVRPFLSFAVETVAGDWYAFDKGIGVEANSTPRPGLRLSGAVSAVRQRHNESQSATNRVGLLDGNEYTARVSADYRVTPRLELGVGLSWRESNYTDDVQFAITDRYSRRYRAEIYARFRHAPLVDIGTGDWSSSLSLSHQQVDWYDTTAFGVDAIWREDWENTITISSEIPLTRDLTMVGGIGHKGYNSTLTLAEYSNWEVYLGISRRF